MQLEWFNCFMETARQKSLTKASEKLNITQPALSKLIRNLERELGVTLFDRTVTGVKLTPAGIHLQDRIEPILESLHVLFNDLKAMNGSEQVKIGVLPSLATYYLPDKMTAIAEAFPDIQLVVGHTTEEVMQWLTAGDVQLVISELGRDPVNHFWRSLLFDEPYYCIFNGSSRFTDNCPLQLADLFDESLVVYPPYCDIRSAIVRNYEAHGRTPKISLEIPFSESILAFVGAGTGITVVPKMIADQARRQGLQTAEVSDFNKSRKIYLIARSEELGKKLRKILVNA